MRDEKRKAIASSFIPHPSPLIPFFAEARSMFITRWQLAWYGAVLLTAGAVIAATGCSTKSGPKVAPVAGKVTVNGQPLTTGSISFRPDGAQGAGHIPSGPIDGQGNYVLFMPQEQKGAPVGRYKVVVMAYDNPRPGHLKPLIDTKYMDENTTPLKVEVIENPEPGRYDLALTGAARASK
jgi:hypothetical protein